MIGQHVLAAVDLGRITAQMARVDDEFSARLREVIATTPGGVTRWPWRTTTYGVLADGDVALDGSTEGPAWHAGGPATGAR